MQTCVCVCVCVCKLCIQTIYQTRCYVIYKLSNKYPNKNKAQQTDSTTLTTNINNTIFIHIK